MFKLREFKLDLLPQQFEGSGILMGGGCLVACTCSADDW